MTTEGLTEPKDPSAQTDRDLIEAEDGVEETVVDLEETEAETVEDNTKLFYFD
jgi:hypothetical protein